jgi:hypothetical protein
VVADAAAVVAVVTVCIAIGVAGNPQGTQSAHDDRRGRPAQTSVRRRV